MKESWNRWGETDEIGALNLILPETVVRATSLVRSGQVLSLAQKISRDMLMPHHRSSVSHFMDRDGGDYDAGPNSRAGGFQYAEDTIIMPLHTGTHVDGLCHCWYDGTLYNGYSAKEVRSNGAHKLSVDKFPPIVGRGVLIDLVALTGAPLADGTPVGPDLIEASLARMQKAIEPGDLVLIRTGWLESQGPEADFQKEPGLNVEGARFLAEAGVSLVGADNFAIEVLPFSANTVFPVHQLLIRDYGIALLEGLVLNELAQARATTFLFAASALPISGATGSPVNPIAVL
jgi:kynurenine formamidase